jgi:nucleoside phosphorylase
MPTRSRDWVDCLIVTALDVERDAVAAMLSDVEWGQDATGTVSAADGRRQFVVAVTEVGMMGSNAAQAATQEAIDRLHPRSVILSGIAAGFPERGVNFGDVLVPFRIVPYEPGKVREDQSGWTRFVPFLKAPVVHEHRGIPLDVSWKLWNVAKNVAAGPAEAWAHGITAQRPDGSLGAPQVHITHNAVIGAGEKVVGSEAAEARQWLIQEFPGAIGLEMESFGVASACRMAAIDLLIVKSMQDTARADKDAPDHKDAWREYATQSSAAFALAVVQHLPAAEGQLAPEHMQEVMRALRRFERENPQPTFSYRVSKAATYGQLRRGVFEADSLQIETLLPDDAAPAIVLHGGGGSGKTRIAQILVARAVDDGRIPVLIDLKRYGARAEDRANKFDLDDLLSATTVPRRTQDELRRLSHDAGVTAIVDGLNEIGREGRQELLAFLQDLHTTSRCFIVATDRIGPEAIEESFVHHAVERLGTEAAEAVYDGAFGDAAYAELPDRLKRIYLRPFFLSLAIRTRRPYVGSVQWSEIFNEFFASHAGLGAEALGTLSTAAHDALKEDKVPGALIRTRLDEADWRRLMDAEVLDASGRDYEHHLWRDYLLARYLARHPESWSDETFDPATAAASSLECLPMAVEQLPDAAARDVFLKHVYDWNYGAAADCVSHFEEDEPSSRELSRGIRIALLAAVAERRFDPVERTRQRARDILHAQKQAVAEELLRATTIEELRQCVARLDDDAEWFEHWRELFVADAVAPPGWNVQSIAAPDSVLGWTAANFARRHGIDTDEQAVVRELYTAHLGAGGKTIRWRIVHVLGTYPSVENISLLRGALLTDDYHWVRYGAARALLEIAARTDTQQRDLGLAALTEFVDDGQDVPSWMRTVILREIVEVAFMEGADEGWPRAVLPLLQEIAAQGPDSNQQKALKERVSDFARAHAL